jgi:hypothetical protein
VETKPNEPIGHHILEANGGKHDQGLTKREFFAAMALQGLYANSDNNNTIDEDAMVAVKAADALIAALNQPKGGV